jgi:hypothetical protein
MQLFVRNKEISLLHGAHRASGFSKKCLMVSIDRSIYARSVICADQGAADETLSGNAKAPARMPTAIRVTPQTRES